MKNYCIDKHMNTTQCLTSQTNPGEYVFKMLTSMNKLRNILLLMHATKVGGKDKKFVLLKSHFPYWGDAR